MDTGSNVRILLVEDDARLAQLTQEYLQAKGGYEVDIEPRGDSAVERIVRGGYTLVILDIMLPGLDGLSVCKRVRPDFRGAILMLTALDDEVDEIVGLEVGADDYVPKPASPRLLLARVKSLLRRTGLAQGPTAAEVEDHLVLGPLRIDTRQLQATLDGAALDLSTAEFDLLLYLARRRGKVTSREALYRDLRGIEWNGLDRSIDQRIKRLRKRLDDDAQQPRWIKSVRGTGYLFVVPT